MNTQNTNAKTTLIIVALLGAATLAQMTHAADLRFDVPTQAVKYHDLNLNTQTGVQVLYKRIERAANQVCGNVGTRDLALAQAHEACVDQAVANAVAAVKNQMPAQAVAIAQVR